MNTSDCWTTCRPSTPTRPSDAVIRTSASRDSHTATAFYSFGEQFLRSIRTSGKFDDWWPKTYQPFVRYDRYDP
jgi:hypothetical protein